MRIKYLSLFLLVVWTFIACHKDGDGPEKNCTQLAVYDLDYHFVTAAKMYDIRPTTPLEIKNGTLEYDLLLQYTFLSQNGANPWPYNHYFVYSSFFNEQDQAIVHFTNVDFFDFDVVRNDCQIDFYRPGDTLHAELISGGAEIAFDRYAIYDHKTATNGTDTFTFLEFRNKLFKSYEQTIAEFAAANVGKYDTIGIELVSSRTKE